MLTLRDEVVPWSISITHSSCCSFYSWFCTFYWFRKLHFLRCHVRFLLYHNVQLEISHVVDLQEF